MQTTNIAIAITTCTRTAIATSIDTAKWRMFTNMCMNMSMRTYISTRIRTNMKRARPGMTMSIPNTLPSRTIMPTIQVISSRMIIGTTRPEAQSGRTGPRSPRRQSDGQAEDAVAAQRTGFPRRAWLPSGALRRVANNLVPP